MPVAGPFPNAPLSQEFEVDVEDNLDSDDDKQSTKVKKEQDLYGCTRMELKSFKESTRLFTESQFFRPTIFDPDHYRIQNTDSICCDDHEIMEKTLLNCEKAADHAGYG